MIARKINSTVFIIGTVVVGLLIAGGLWNNFSKRGGDTLPVGSTMTGKDGATLVYVPAGKFIMGSDRGYEGEKPAHVVYLDAFWIDQKEMTNERYAACVFDGGCTPPVDISIQTFPGGGVIQYYGNVQFDEFPVLNVDWNQALAYCSWAGRELPTEAQWEKAARGPDGSLYPWQDDSLDSSFANFGSDVLMPTKTGSYEKGKSYYGAYDMAGNADEWVNDWFDWEYYENSPRSNPLGPATGQDRVIRGGSWVTVNVHAFRRYMAEPSATSDDDRLGFRCAVSLN